MSESQAECAARASEMAELIADLEAAGAVTLELRPPIGFAVERRPRVLLTRPVEGLHLQGADAYPSEG